jgi:DNA-binding NtrC family response regulator
VAAAAVNLRANSKEEVVKEKLESLVAEMIERRIYLDEALGEFEKKFIQNALVKTGGNQTKAAQVLGVHRNTLNRKIAQHKLNGHR